ncbi:MAG TPA: OmpA family protein [Solirubrobacteraceae bacterium]|nr:OmpA family protein [Solirubrobacteraceae bacterium]
MTTEPSAAQVPEAAPPAQAAPAAIPDAAPSAPLHHGIGNAAFGQMVAAGQVPAVPAGAGNAALARMLSSPRMIAREGEPTAEQIAEADAWAAEGIRRGTNLTPGAPGAGLNNAPGGFDAEYDPAVGELVIIMRCGVEFTDGISRAGVARPGLQNQLDRANALPEPQRRARLAQFRWSEDKSDPERVAFKSGVETQIESFWGGRHEFFLRKQGWSWLGATVRIDLQVADKEDVPNAHLTMRPVKVPADVSLGANVEPGQLENAQDQVMNLSSNLNASGSFLNHFVTFGVNSSDVVGGQATKLQQVIDTFKGAEQPGQPGTADTRSIQTPVVLTGHASSTGTDEYNQALSERRVDSVADFMARNGFVNVVTRVSGEGVGESEATGGEVEHDRRVDIVIGSGNSQNTISHEFGHAFGLGDEYANTPLVSSGLGRNTGTPQMGDDATHDTLVKQMVDAGGTPLAGAVCEPTDSIMSVGDVVRPQHYATFHASLTEITAQSPWALGPPTGRNDPLPGGAAAETGPGDFPVPSRGEGEPVAV